MWEETKTLNISDIIFSRIECLGVPVIVTESPTVSSLPLHLQLFDLFSFTNIVIFGTPSYDITPIVNRGLAIITLCYFSPTNLADSTLTEWYALMEKYILGRNGAGRESAICIQDDTAGIKAAILLSLLMYRWGISLENTLRRRREYFPRAVFTSDEESFFYTKIATTKKVPYLRRLLFIFQRSRLLARLQY